MPRQGHEHSEQKVVDKAPAVLPQDLSTFRSSEPYPRHLRRLPSAQIMLILFTVTLTSTYFNFHMEIVSGHFILIL